MPDANATLWMPSSETLVASALRKLISEGEQQQACVLLVRLACAGSFGSLANTLAEMSDFSLKGMRILLSERAAGSFGLEYAVSQAGIWAINYPLIATAIDLAREARKATGSSLSIKAQSFLLKKILESPDVKALKLSRQFVDALFVKIDQPSEQVILEMIGKAGSGANSESIEDGPESRAGDGVATGEQISASEAAQNTESGADEKP